MRQLQAGGIFAIRNPQQWGKALYELMEEETFDSWHSPGSDLVFALAGKTFRADVVCSERLNLYDAVEEAKKSAGGQTVPVVIHKRKRREWLATIPLADLLDIV